MNYKGISHNYVADLSPSGPSTIRLYWQKICSLQNEKFAGGYKPLTPHCFTTKDGLGLNSFAHPSASLLGHCDDWFSDWETGSVADEREDGSLPCCFVFIYFFIFCQSHTFLERSCHLLKWRRKWEKQVLRGKWCWFREAGEILEPSGGQVEGFQVQRRGPTWTDKSGSHQGGEGIYEKRQKGDEVWGMVLGSLRYLTVREMSRSSKGGWERVVWRQQETLGSLRSWMCSKDEGWATSLDDANVAKKTDNHWILDSS